MRLTDRQQHAIIESFTAHFEPEDALWLFGSRVDPTKKGGDIDLYIETHCPDWAVIAKKQIAFLVALKKKIGDQKIDVVICSLTSPRPLPIHEEAKTTGIRLR